MPTTLSIIITVVVGSVATLAGKMDTAFKELSVENSHSTKAGFKAVPA